ncbi:MAG: hypothetical protein OXC91_15640 [Rhodobacteraceae bacterium]|nr:hypothetical protein [Paracoccaceae bacterium]
MPDGPFDASFDLALESCPYFGLEPDQARHRARRMTASVAEFWKSELRGAGLASNEIRTYADAFGHAEAESALRTTD